MFWMTLALSLGMSLKECKEQIDSYEFAQWMAYNQISPLGAVRSDWQTAQISMMVAASGGVTKKNKRPFSIADFMYDQPEPRRQDPKEMEAMMKMNVQKYNSRFSKP